MTRRRHCGRVWPELVRQIRSLASAPVALGGCGFSVFPVEIVNICKSDFGIIGDGEEAFLRLARALSGSQDYHALPGLVWREADGRCVLNPPQPPAALDVSPDRGLLDNARYFREGGQGSVETKRGCPMSPGGRGSRVAAQARRRRVAPVRRRVQHSARSRPGGLPRDHPARAGAARPVVCLLQSAPVLR